MECSFLFRRHHRKLTKCNCIFFFASGEKKTNCTTLFTFDLPSFSFRSCLDFCHFFVEELLTKVEAVGGDGAMMEEDHQNLENVDDLKPPVKRPALQGESEDFYLSVESSLLSA